MTTSSSMAPALSRVGPGSPAPAAGGFDPHRAEFRHLEAEASEFVHEVHAARYGALLPLLLALAFGLALLLVAGLSPPPSTLLSMLSGDDTADPAAGSRAMVGDGYELPAHWQWPALATPPAPALRLACDPALDGDAC